jgi:hypothetical protein
VSGGAVHVLLVLLGPIVRAARFGAQAVASHRAAVRSF